MGEIEGEWKNFTFRMLLESDIPEVHLHLRKNFYLDEPVSNKIGHSSLKFDEFDQAVSNSLKAKLSFAAFDKETGKIAAIRTITRHEKNEGFSKFEFTSKEMRLAVQFLSEVDSQCNIFDIYKVNEYADLRIQSVDRQWRGKGLATEMYKRALDMLRQSGFKVVKSVFTSPHTRKIAAKFGFAEHSRKYFREILDENGGFICPHACNDEFAAVMALRI